MAPSTHMHTIVATISNLTHVTVSCSYTASPLQGSLMHPAGPQVLWGPHHAQNQGVLFTCLLHMQPGPRELTGPTALASQVHERQSLPGYPTTEQT